MGKYKISIGIFLGEVVVILVQYLTYLKTLKIYLFRIFVRVNDTFYTENQTTLSETTFLE